MSTVVRAAVPRVAGMPVADPSGRSSYSQILDRRLLDLAERLMRKPGDPDLRKALNDALYEATRNLQAIVSGEALVKARRALEHSKPHGPVRHRGPALQGQLDPTGARTPYSRRLEAELRLATTRYLAVPSAENRQRLNDTLHEARHSRDAVVSLDALTRADRALGAQPVRAAVAQQVNIRSAPGGDALPGDYVGVESRDEFGRKVLTQARLRAHLVMDDGGQWRVTRIEAVGPHVTVDGRPSRQSQKVYVVRDAQGQPITDPAQAADRVREMLRHGAMTAPAPRPRSPGAVAPKPPQPASNTAEAMQPFVGVNLGTPGARQVLGRLPGVGPDVARALQALGDHAPGTVVVGARTGTVFFSSKEATVSAVPGLPLKPVVVMQKDRPTQIGLGNCQEFGPRGDNVWFLNARILPAELARIVTQSRANPSKTYVAATVNYGILTVPACKDTKDSGNPLGALAIGTNLQGQLVVSGGEAQIRSGPITLPPALFQTVLSAAGAALAARNELACKARDVQQTVNAVAQQAMRSVSQQVEPQTFARHAVAVGALIAAIAAEALGLSRQFRPG